MRVRIVIRHNPHLMYDVVLYDGSRNVAAGYVHLRDRDGHAVMQTRIRDGRPDHADLIGMLVQILMWLHYEATPESDIRREICARWHLAADDVEVWEQ